MTEEELRRIETSLGITLPTSYKRLMSPFAVRCLRGNADTDLWDNANRLIAINQELRSHPRSPWPSHWFFLGDPLSGCANAIDLRDPVACVSWIDHCDLRTVEGVKGNPFETWLHDWESTARADLEKNGIDPNRDSPPSRDKGSKTGRAVAIGGALIAAGVIALGIIKIAMLLVRGIKAIHP